MIVVGVVAAYSHTYAAGFNPVSNSLGGIIVAQLAIGVLSVLALTNDYSTEMIRSTFTVTP